MVPLDFLGPSFGRGMGSDEVEDAVETGDEAEVVSMEFEGSAIVGVILDMVRRRCYQGKR